MKTTPPFPPKGSFRKITAPPPFPEVKVFSFSALSASSVSSALIPGSTFAAISLSQFSTNPSLCPDCRMNHPVKIILYVVLILLGSISGYYAFTNFGRMMDRAANRTSELEQIEPEKKQIEEPAPQVTPPP